MADLSDIEKFAELKEKGLLSKQELAIKRREVLGLPKRRTWPLVIFMPLLALASFVVGGYAGDAAARWLQTRDSAELAATEPSDLDKDGIISCQSPRLKERILATAFPQRERGRVSLGPLRETLVQGSIKARRCEGEVSVDGRPTGPITVWAVMEPVRRFRVIANHAIAF
jgi:hypothetical protein